MILKAARRVLDRWFGGRRNARGDQVRQAFRRRYDALRARYDAALTNDDNRRHWTNADHLSPAAAAKPDVRRTLRSRARYEFHESNSFGKGLILTLATDTIGTGPRLKVSTPDPAINQRLERSFYTWSRASRLAAKLRTMRMSKAVDGEAFALATTNERLPHPVKLDLRLVEADQFTTPDLAAASRRRVDGIDFDQDGNPVRYWMLRGHPGSDHNSLSDLVTADPVDAGDVLHYFREDRPGQARGIPEVTSALPLFAQLRRYTLAVIAAAETAAEFAGVMYTDGPAVEIDEDVEAMDAIELEMRSLLTLPAGWKMGQVKAEQPATTYSEFRDAVLAEVARCVLMPINKASGSSAGYNFASGRLDFQSYFDAIEVERSEVETLLERILFWWLDEAALIPGLIPDGLGLLADLPHAWRWPRHRHIDPQKQANADITLWERGLLTDEEFFARESIDPEDHYQQLAQQVARREVIGVPQAGEADRQPTLADAVQQAADQQATDGGQQ